MVLSEKQIKKVHEVIKKIGTFKMKLGYVSKNWLDDLESETLFLGCANLRKACLFAALDTAGRTWWNSIPDVAQLNFAELREQFLQRWCPDTILQPQLQAYFKQRKQKPRENVQEFSEAFLILLDQLNPTMSEEASIAAFEDKLHKEISAALAGDRFDTLREASRRGETNETRSASIFRIFKGN